MAVKEWIGRPQQNAQANNEIKDWKLIQVRHFGVRDSASGNPGFDEDVSDLADLGQVDIRLDAWKGTTKEKLDLVGKTDVIDVRKADKFKYVDGQGNTIELIVNRVVQFADTLELGLKYG